MSPTEYQSLFNLLGTILIVISVWELMCDSSKNVSKYVLAAFGFVSGFVFFMLALYFKSAA
jgi:hypothetical protein